MAVCVGVLGIASAAASSNGPAKQILNTVRDNPRVLIAIAVILVMILMVFTLTNASKAKGSKKDAGGAVPFVGDDGGANGGGSGCSGGGGCGGGCGGG